MISSHKIAGWLLHQIANVFDALGFGHSEVSETVVYVFIVVALALGIGWGVRHIALFVTERIVLWRESVLGKALLRERTLLSCSHVIPPLVVMVMIPVAFDEPSVLQTVIWRAVLVYTTVAVAIGVNAVITFVFNRYNEHENTRNLPLKGILNIVKGAVWIVVSVLVVSVVINKSPGALLAGLGAFAAALMLIFKDSMLGFVAGIQMSQNDMVRVGDWICVPSTPANGIVLDVSLSTVKVRNFDFTIIMIPPYTIVSTAVQNYRGMRESGVREIQRTFTFRYSDIVSASAEFVAALSARYTLLAGFVSQLKSGQTATFDGGIHQQNGAIETNLGLFRAYVYAYLLHHEKIAQDQRVMVRVNQPDETGVPLQIWCYASDNDWTAYCAIQSQICEHILAVAPTFGLQIYTPGRVELTPSPPRSA
jgi:miniconductance mechanosensitive channel